MGIYEMVIQIYPLRSIKVKFSIADFEEIMEDVPGAMAKADKICWLASSGATKSMLQLAWSYTDDEPTKYDAWNHFVVWLMAGLSAPPGRFLPRRLVHAWLPV